MHIFIDANIYLSFYEQSPDALVELAKLAAVIKNGKAKLWLPDQVKREFWKNREGSITTSLREFDKSLHLGSIPRLVREDPEFKTLTDRVQLDVTSEKTAADNEVRALFELATEIDTTGEIFSEASDRALRHTPPGKLDGIGDRLSWVALLRTLPKKADLQIISMDGDFASEGSPNDIKPYLNAEWTTKIGGTVKLWKRASQFLAAHFPEAATAIEIERTLMIERLETSPNFMTTHAIIAEFSDISHLSKPLVNRLATALFANSQVSWLIGDEDVKKFVLNFLGKYGCEISPSLKEMLEGLITK